MSARLLAVITPGEEATALASLAGLSTIARAAHADVRLAYFHELPEPRLDRHGRVVADTDAEMARIAGATTATLIAGARVYDDVAIDTVVRFGALRREVRYETEVYAPHIIVMFDAATHMLARLRGWVVRRALGRRHDARLLVLQPPGLQREGYADTLRRLGTAPLVKPPAPLPARRD